MGEQPQRDHLAIADDYLGSASGEAQPHESSLPGLVWATVGIGHAVVALAQAATRIANALEQGIEAQRERGNWP